MSAVRPPVQFSIAGLLALTAVLAFSLGLVRYGLGNIERPVSGQVAVVLGVLGLAGIGATAGCMVGHAVRGPAGAVWGGSIGAFLTLAVVLTWVLRSLPPIFS